MCESLCETVKVKPRLCWRLQDIGDPRAVRHLPKRAAFEEWNQPEREKYVTGSKAGRAAKTSELAQNTPRQQIFSTEEIYDSRGTSSLPRDWTQTTAAGPGATVLWIQRGEEGKWEE